MKTLDKLYYGQKLLVECHPTEYVMFGEIGIISLNSPTEKIEMEVSKYRENDKDANAYKVKLIPVKDEDKKRFGNKNFYSSDLLSSIRNGGRVCLVE